MLRALERAAAVVLAAVAASCAGSAPSSQPQTAERSVVSHRAFDRAQVPAWTEDDLEFFLHGSLGTEVLPERVLTAFRATYPDLFPGEDLSAFGLVETPGELPVGISRREVAHLGGLPSLGINCAACHVTEVRPADGGSAVRLIGTTGHFDAEAFLGAVTAAGLRTAEPANMARFLRNYAASTGRTGGGALLRFVLDAAIDSQRHAIAAAIEEDPGGAKGVGPGELQEIAPADLDLDRSLLEDARGLPKVVRAFLHLFHNMRTALHVPDQLPSSLPPPSGPGRNDAFGLLSASLFQSPTEYAPVKYGLVWNAGTRPWVHWDGNTRSPLGRNVLAALGLGAPLLGRRGVLDLALVERHTALTQAIRPPAYPWSVDAAAAARGAPHYEKRCASCHDGPADDRRLHDPAEIGTDPRRARAFDAAHAELFNRFFQELRIDGWRAPAEPPIRATGRYLAPDLGGVWARSPYLHNGSVRTLADLLTPPASRPATLRRGSHVYDTARMGFLDDGPYVLDATAPGNGNGGHDYGTDLAPDDKRDLIEYLKTR